MPDPKGDKPKEDAGSKEVPPSKERLLPDDDDENLFDPDECREKFGKMVADVITGKVTGYGQGSFSYNIL